ncbi:hypothetical protein [Agathobaculum sp.]|uniref:hypothetical protein n=1 Tax=Agathobaculum sp. TaxID=2048138 RepID=UPI002A7FC935|nr:hypothetical protein [Agathobaculum sp.]MDY3617700.1 hypothetical protein [Agathobaculum sp.]
MSFSDHKITKFTHTVSELPDQPSLPPKDLKARFDSSPEELREAVNGICDDAERLDGRVSGIITQTFEDAISKTMLSTELQNEIDGKAAASDNTAAHKQLQSAIAQKCEIYIGSYIGDGTEWREFSLGFYPRAVLVMCANYDSERRFLHCLATREQHIYDYSSIDKKALEVTENGFAVYGPFSQRTTDNYLNVSAYCFNYIAFK